MFEVVGFNYCQFGTGKNAVGVSFARVVTKEELTAMILGADKWVHASCWFVVCDDVFYDFRPGRGWRKMNKRITMTHVLSQREVARLFPIASGAMPGEEDL